MYVFIFPEGDSPHGRMNPFHLIRNPSSQVYNILLVACVYLQLSHQQNDGEIDVEKIGFKRVEMFKNRTRLPGCPLFWRYHQLIGHQSTRRFYPI